MTFAELKAQLDLLTADQLAADIVWSGDERGGKVVKLWVADEDWLGTEDGDCEPRSVLDPGDHTEGHAPAFGGPMKFAELKVLCARCCCGSKLLLTSKVGRAHRNLLGWDRGWYFPAGGCALLVTRSAR